MEKNYVAPGLYFVIADMKVVNTKDALMRLPDNERAAAERYKSPVAAQLYTAARIALRSELSDTWKLPFNTPLAFSKQGKPRLAESSLPYFNLSHSGELVTVAFAPQPVGIDLQRRVSYPKDWMMSLAERIFTPNELAYLDAIADIAVARDYFTRRWTLKESLVKASGLGLGGGKLRETNLPPIADRQLTPLVFHNRNYKAYSLHSGDYFLTLSVLSVTE